MPLSSLLLFSALVLFLDPASAHMHGGGFSSPLTFAGRASTRPQYPRAYNGSRRSKPTGLEFLEDDNEPKDLTAVKECSAASITQNLLRGAFLRVASDLSGGTPLESIKCRVTATYDGPVAATRGIVKDGGLLALWAGTPSRTVEGALLGAAFFLSSSFTKTRMKALGAGPTACALAAGLVGGVAQAFVMTPAGLIFTSLNVNQGKKGYENDNAITVINRVVKEKGALGMFAGFGAMATRQASNWASRAGFTEICRTTLGLSGYGMWGELASGTIGGIGSCWNTPIETIRVFMHRDISMGLQAKSFGQYWTDIVDDQGYVGLFRGVTPRGIQAIWQTIWMVVIPNMFGF